MSAVGLLGSITVSLRGDGEAPDERPRANDYHDGAGPRRFGVAVSTGEVRVAVWGSLEQLRRFHETLGWRIDEAERMGGPT